MNKYVPVAARVLLAQIFLIPTIIQVIQISSHPDGYLAYQMFLAKLGLWGIFVPLTILIQSVGSTALLFGYKTKVAAYTLAGYAVFVAVFMKFGDPIAFMQYMAISGGMLAMAVLAPTACSLDNLKK